VVLPCLLDAIAVHAEGTPGSGIATMSQTAATRETYTQTEGQASALPDTAAKPRGAMKTGTASDLALAGSLGANADGHGSVPTRMGNGEAPAGACCRRACVAAPIQRGISSCALGEPPTTPKRPSESAALKDKNKVRNKYCDKLRPSPTVRAVWWRARAPFARLRSFCTLTALAIAMRAHPSACRRTARTSARRTRFAAMLFRTAYLCATAEDVTVTIIATADHERGVVPPQCGPV
jgi:hypothetical protein